MSRYSLIECKGIVSITTFLRNFDMNYIIFRNVEIFKNKFQYQNYVNKSIESSRIFYLKFFF